MNPTLSRTDGDKMKSLKSRPMVGIGIVQRYVDAAGRSIHFKCTKVPLVVDSVTRTSSRRVVSKYCRRNEQKWESVDVVVEESFMGLKRMALELALARLMISTKKGTTSDVSEGT